MPLQLGLAQQLGFSINRNWRGWIGLAVTLLFSSVKNIICTVMHNRYAKFAGYLSKIAQRVPVESLGYPLISLRTIDIVIRGGINEEVGFQLLNFPPSSLGCNINLAGEIFSLAVQTRHLVTGNENPNPLLPQHPLSAND